MFLVNHCPSYRDLHSFPTRRSSDLATAAFTWALSQGANALQEVNGSGTSDPDMFTKNPDVVDNISVDRSEEHTSELQSRGQTVCRLRRETKTSSYRASQT